MTEKAVLSWSSGKDSAWCLHVLRQRADVTVVGLLTTVNQQFDRVAMHAVRSELLREQAAAVGLPLLEVPIPWPCRNEQYEAAMAAATETVKARGVSVMAFGDLFLEDVRAYREQKLSGTGLRPIFPLWKFPTHQLARDMVEAGLQARLTCVDPRVVPRELAGRAFDHKLLEDLPEEVDPCGERGEFHTFVHDGPMFSRRVEVEPGEIVERDGFVFADLLPRRA